MIGLRWSEVGCPRLWLAVDSWAMVAADDYQSALFPPWVLNPTTNITGDHPQSFPTQCRVHRGCVCISSGLLQLPMQTATLAPSTTAVVWGFLVLSVRPDGV